MNTMMFQEMPTCARSEVAELPLNWFSSPPSLLPLKRHYKQDTFGALVSLFTCS